MQPFSTAVYEPRSDSDGLSRRSISAGRALVTEIQFQDQTLLLKQYSRGGFIRRFSRDSYIWTGMKRTRAAREVRLLAALHASGLPVPKPLGCRVERLPGRYRAYLATGLIADCESLDKVLFTNDDPEIAAHFSLGSESNSNTLWEAAGLCLARFRRAGVYHADLNLSNILLDRSGKIYLVDFDRCYQADPDGRRYEALAQRMLTRLLRSIGKFEAKSAVQVSQADRESLVTAFWS